MKRRKKCEAWGTFCPTCLTVYAYPHVPSLCYGDYQRQRHERAICAVLAVWR